MKTLLKYIGIIAFTMFALVGCEKDFDEINTNPNSPDVTQSQFLLTYAQRQFAFALYDTWFSGRMTALACQHWSQRNYTDEDRYTFRTNVTNNYFRNLYFYLMNLQELIRLNTDEATKQDAEDISGPNDAQIATAMILRAFVIQVMTDTWGDIPYSQAFDPNQYATPEYDPQQAIYSRLLDELQEAVALIGTTTRAWNSGGDVIYGGDMTKWVKFANSLRLRLAVRMNRVNPTGAADAANAAIAAGVFESNDDNAVFNFIGDGAPNHAPIYDAFFPGARNDFSPTKQYVNLMKGMDDPDIRDGGYTNPFNGIVDPRLAIYRGPANDENTIGIPYGMNDAQMKSYVNANLDVIINYWLSPLAVIVEPSYGSTFLDYPTVCFMMSEVNNWNRASFEDGVRASCEMWGVPAADITPYVSSVMAVYDAAPESAREELVMTQKYIHLYTQSNEAWAEYRRTGFPKSLVKPGEVTLGGDNPITFSPDNYNGHDIVTRFTYPNSEYTLNGANIQAAIDRQGDDSYDTQIWWDVRVRD
ncbi:MAG: SusD/RagB family nutrient-binding outer membrane lipoprotein [Tenuifilaceae bacterium]|mgnify:FL=1|jgi:hypothetical protein|nr:SusD/RagB family nutrient-binding outer membrane lipoprotein [Bacteroidota bacterium]MZP81395.1 SusD/RagB family nutrient-binding outer membrane lipoprotein [Bacteroidales bacterium]NLH55432.1 SusD/RagB family nutrient-binding outer membrane lipoprotein [Rikenellaceae bacterium]OQC64838.1 MAG: Susd and RagB outer membrane lipoprotein [Bacteroidetes bacterium ADurb.Bin008]HNV81735.1 SusD/RagB family nutrient-binding outer membrane lipoprotein [Tenuifilaceae bacterium]